MPLSQKDRQQLLGFLIFLGLGVIGAYWYFLWNPNRADLAAVQTEIDSLTAQVDSAKADLAAGTVEELRERVERYEANLSIMRRLVPTGDEVTVLIDDIASRAALRGVEIAQFNREAAEPGPMFDTHRYGWSVFGHYDEIGDFLSDIARLERIMVPYNVSLQPAQETEQTNYGDTTGALLRVDFQLRTFVKTQTPGGTGESS
jgi:type IV pilus assembly protein PilO